MEEPLDEADVRTKRLVNLGGEYKDEYLEERFFKYGVKPEWLLVHRVLNHRTLRDGRILYFVKWRELQYDQATWEEESDEIPGLKSAIEYYMVRGILSNLLIYFSSGHPLILFYVT